jgi:hypothetical protein
MIDGCSLLSLLTASDSHGFLALSVDDDKVETINETVVIIGALANGMFRICKVLTFSRDSNSSILDPRWHSATSREPDTYITPCRTTRSSTTATPYATSITEHLDNRSRRCLGTCMGCRFRAAGSEDWPIG